MSEGVSDGIMIDPTFIGVCLPLKALNRLVVLMRFKSKDVRVDSSSRLVVPYDEKRRYLGSFDSELRIGGPTPCCAPRSYI